MAKVKEQDGLFKAKPKKSGGASKSKTSSLKSSKNYVKSYKGQGK